MPSVTPKRGQIWEFVTSTVHHCGEVRRYELEKSFSHFYGDFAYLRNLETDEVAKVTAKWLREGERQAPNGHWRLSS